MLKHLANGISAGILISLGCAAYLSCDNKYAGAALFSLALMCICMLGYNLYTGKICYMVEDHGKEALSRLLLGLLGNLIGTLVFGIILRYSIPSLVDASLLICRNKLNESFFSALARGFMCGILIYLSVDIYRKYKRVIGILIMIPAFILSGFEHSIANMCYFTVSGIVSFEAFVYIWIIILGNTLGGIIIPLLQRIGGNND